MKARLLISLIAVSLVACPVQYKAMLRNSSAELIFVPPPYSATWATQIASGAQVEVHWYQECMTIVDRGASYYFEGFPLPEGVARAGLFSVDLDAEFEGGQLFVIGNDSVRLPLNKSEQCRR